MPAGRCATVALLLGAGCLLSGTWPGAGADARVPGTERTADGTDSSPSAAPEPPAALQRLELATGDTLMGVLRERAGLNPTAADEAATAVEEQMDPRLLRAGQSLAYAVSTPRGETPQRRRLERLSIRRDIDSRLVVTRGDDGELVARIEKVSHRRAVRTRRFTVEGSFYASASEAEVPAAVVLDAYRQLSNRVDFQRDLRAGDSISLVFEDFRHDQGRTHPGQLLAVRLQQRQRTLEIYRFATPDGISAFYNRAGVSVETTLSQTPVKGGRLSSLFGKREHPILGYTRQHEGLDFAAGRGTPIVAAGAGRVTRRGPYGSYGNYVRIRHDSRLSTAYAHLSRFADGLDAGDRVEQGQVIGYVGASGVATGPNLHYEVLRNGTPVDPRTLDLPPRRRLTGKVLARFAERARALNQAMSAGKSPATAGAEAQLPRRAYANGQGNYR